MEKSRIEQLQKLAKQTRIEILRMIQAAGSGHLAGSLGMVEVFTYFYHEVLRLEPTNPQWSERDYFLLSAGHLCPVWYATLASRGFWEKGLLKTLRQFGSPLQGHPERNLRLGIENTSGSLGQGVSMAAGIAYGLKQQKSNEQKVMVVSSDGEQNEGQVWESYLFAANYNLDNLTIIVDVNGIQQSGRTDKVMETRDLKEKFLAFNFAVGVCEGNDFESIERTWQELQAVPYPKALLCQTIPGKGVSWMENDYKWHSNQPTAQQWQQALTEVGK